MTKSQELNNLFEKWKTSRVYGKRFTADGIIDESEFEKASKKVLFICKEPNDPEQKGGDYRSWWKEDALYYAFSYRISEWSYGILNDFPEYDIIWGIEGKSDLLPSQAIKQIAFMNVKKIGGKGSSKETEIKETIESDFDFIMKEMEIIDPQYIVLSLSWTSLVEVLFGKLEWLSTGYDIKIAGWQGKVVIDYYHPSRISPAPAYVLLEKVFNSKAMKALQKRLL